MTANAERRRRFTVVGAILGLVGVVAVIAVSILAVSTLRTSQEGRAANVEEREVVSFPETPNAVIGIVDDLDRLTSLAVVTLDPSGVGGSIVVLPVNIDETIGFGPARLPLSRQPYAPGDDAAALVGALEPVLTLTLEHSVVAGPDELAALLEPLGPFDVDLPERVIDSDTPGSGFVARPGSSTLDTDTMVDALTAIDVAGHVIRAPWRRCRTLVGDRSHGSNHQRRPAGRRVRSADRPCDRSTSSGSGCSPATSMFVNWPSTSVAARQRRQRDRRRLRPGIASRCAPGLRFRSRPGSSRRPASRCR